MERNKLFEYIMSHSKVLRPPKYHLATFGVTTLYYYLVSELTENKTRIREGEVSSQRPKIIAPQQMSNLFEGFGDEAKEFTEMLFPEFHFDLRILEYKFKNELKKVHLVSEPLELAINRINKKIEGSGDGLTTIIQGVEHFWQISLMKFIVEITKESFHSNVTELEERGFFPDHTGVPRQIREEIEKLFIQAQGDRWRIKILGKRLYDLGLFEEYEDRFFAFFKKER